MSELRLRFEIEIDAQNCWFIVVQKGFSVSCDQQQLIQDTASRGPKFNIKIV